MTSAPPDPNELRIPTSAELTGLSNSMIEDILLRCAVAEGRLSMVRLADRLHCSVGVIDNVINAMRDRRLVEYEGMEGRSYLISVTEAGRGS